ncbi:hypothetical protein L1887_15676 [Cichorium endivia]|nr:hypothetical protein L1887_15676 [Cichorium endivia]
MERRLKNIRIGNCVLMANVAKYHRKHRMERNTGDRISGKKGNRSSGGMTSVKKENGNSGEKTERQTRIGKDTEEVEKSVENTITSNSQRRGWNSYIIPELESNENIDGKENTNQAGTGNGEQHSSIADSEKSMSDKSQSSKDTQVNQESSSTRHKNLKQSAQNKKNLKLSAT